MNEHWCEGDFPWTHRELLPAAQEPAAAAGGHQNQKKEHAMNERTKTRDALTVLRSATHKVNRIKENVDAALRKPKELRLMELVNLQTAMCGLVAKVEASIKTLQSCLASIKPAEGRSTQDVVAITEST